MDHWVAFLDDFNYSPKEFYAAIEKELEARQIPGMTISRDEFAEGGMLSGKRIYLKLCRERLVIYTCASTFGTGYFFSCRTMYVPALVRLWHILAVLLGFGVLGWLLLKPLGLVFTGIALVALLFALIDVMRRAAGSAFGDIDAFLLKIPGISTIYEDWFRAETYWREDARMAYLQRVPAIIKATAEETTAAKGAKLVQQFQRSPIFGDLYHPVPPQRDLATR